MKESAHIVSLREVLRNCDPEYRGMLEILIEEIVVNKEEAENELTLTKEALKYLGFGTVQKVVVDNNHSYVVVNANEAEIYIDVEDLNTRKKYAYLLPQDNERN